MTDAVLPIIDWDTSIGLLNGNTQLAKDMLSLLLVELKETKPRLIPLLEAGDLTTLCELVHKLRGGSSYCGVPQLGHSCAVLEKTLKSDLASPEIKPLTIDLVKTIDAVLTAAPDYLQKT